jgi:NitT/TauT family transport system permease protein
MRSALWIRVTLVVGAVLLLEALCRTGVIQPVTMIPPSRMAGGLIALFQNGKVYPPLTKTMGNVATAFVLSVGVGFLLGLMIHAAPRLRRALDPWLASYYAVPFFVFYPLLIVIFGMNDLPIVVIGFLFGVVAMLLNTLNGLDRVAQVLLKTGRVLRMGPARTALQIRLPAAAPYLLTGVKLSVAYSFIGVIASEFILSGAGLGYTIAYAFNNFDNLTMYSLMLLVLLIVVAVNSVLHVWEQRMLRQRGLLRQG